MRRLFVIFLILLFPLNVLALSMSVSTAQPDGAHTHASMTGSDAFQANANANADIDPDEPPSVADLHDLVHQDTRLNLAGLRAAAVPQHAAPPDRLSLPPPDKPPRRA